jgi:flagellar FliJ protein
MFNFRLQSVLNFRKRQEEEKQRDLAVVNMEQRKISDDLNGLVDEREAKSRELNSLFSRPTDVNMLRLYSNFLSGRDTDIEKKIRELAASKERLRQKQLELQEYVKRKRVLEVLKERRLETHTREEHRKELVFLDETATNIWFQERR